MNKRWNEKSTVIRQWIKNIKHEKIVLVRNAKLNLDPGRGDYGDGGDRWSFARGRPLRMIIWKRPVTPDDHLQKAGPSGWSFARGWSLQMIIYNMQDALSINKPTRDPRGPKIYVELNIYKKMNNGNTAGKDDVKLNNYEDSLPQTRVQCKRISHPTAVLSNRIRENRQRKNNITVVNCISNFFIPYPS